MPAPRIHRLRPDALASLRVEQLSMFAFVLLCTAVAAFELGARTVANADVITAVVIVALAGAVAWAVDGRRRRLAWKRFFVTIDDDSIEVPRGVHVNRILRTDVAHIVRTVWPARGLVVRAPNRRPLFIPQAVESFDAIEGALAGWKPLEDSRVPEALVRLWPFVVVFVCALELVALGRFAPPLVAAASFGLAGIALWSFTNVLRSHRLSPRAKLLSSALLIPAAYLVWNGVRALGG